MNTADKRRSDKMSAKIPKRIAQTIMSSLQGGVVPRTGLGYIAVGRTNEIKALVHDADIAESGGSFFRMIIGRYGSGKSFLMQTFRQHLMERGFVTADADLSPERRFMGNQGQGLSTYRELMRNLSVRSKPEGGALPLILEKWIDGIRKKALEDGAAPDDPFFDTAVENGILDAISELKGMIHGFDFAKVIIEYYRGYTAGDNTKAENALRWLRGECPNRTFAKNTLGVFSAVSDENWYDYLKLMAEFFVSAGYKGLVIMVDELVNILRIHNSVTRINNYEKILAMYNDVLQGKAAHMGIILGGTPQLLEDKQRGVYSYEALRSRLASGRFVNEKTADMLSPIITVRPLTYEEMTVLVEKLTEIHSGLYGYEPRITQEERIDFIKNEYERVGADSKITPREMIRDYIELLNVAMQYPEMSIAEITGSEKFEYAEPDGETAEADGFEDFTL